LIKLFMTSGGEREEVITEFVLEVKDGDDKWTFSTDPSLQGIGVIK
jgi:hypothetical protein